MPLVRSATDAWTATFSVPGTVAGDASTSLEKVLPSVPYWNTTVASKLRALTVPLNVALVGAMLLAALIVTAGSPRVPKLTTGLTVVPALLAAEMRYQ